MITFVFTRPLATTFIPLHYYSSLAIFRPEVCPDRLISPWLTDVNVSFVGTDGRSYMLPSPLAWKQIVGEM